MRQCAGIMREVNKRAQHARSAHLAKAKYPSNSASCSFELAASARQRVAIAQWPSATTGQAIGRRAACRIGVALMAERPAPWLSMRRKYRNVGVNAAATVRRDVGNTWRVQADVAISWQLPAKIMSAAAARRHLSMYSRRGGDAAATPTNRRSEGGVYGRGRQRNMCANM